MRSSITNVVTSARYLGSSFPGCAAIQDTRGIAVSGRFSVDAWHERSRGNRSGGPMPRISVIMPVYNGEAFIAEAIRSVIAQTYACWELIVVDDGSIDNTRQVVSGFTDQRIAYISQENQGLAAARNTGIQHSKGEYLAFLDHDDLWAPTFLERCVSALQLVGSGHLVGVYTSYVHIAEDGGPLPQAGCTIAPPAQLYMRLLEGGLFPPHAALTRATAVKAV